MIDRQLLVCGSFRFRNLRRVTICGIKTPSANCMWNDQHSIIVRPAAIHFSTFLFFLIFNLQWNLSLLNYKTNNLFIRSALIFIERKPNQASESVHNWLSSHFYSFRMYPAKCHFCATSAKEDSFVDWYKWITIFVLRLSKTN